ncbi:transposase [Cerasicoccus fimbriatus]|uniref:transposase n=1 Tax=Cerasicoccus fimbriatus TaxID=3014554 RepID=UPI0022B2C1AA|nr:transposase [Cerasicoccus sp. TK19100]
METWLDAGMGSCLLSERPAIETVANARKHFDGKRYHLDHWVIMPNHVHLIVLPFINHALSDILHSWKSFTAKRLNRPSERAGAVWQSESYSRIIRDEAELRHYREYILENPNKAGLDLAEDAIGTDRIDEKLEDK